MKKLISFLCFVFSTAAFAQPYDISDSLINKAHERSTYFAENSFFNVGTTFEDFIKKADKTKPTVLHSHGCSGVTKDEFTLKKFYTSLGFNFVILDFVKRGDAGVCQHLGSGNSNYKEDSKKYSDDLKYRLPARLLELENHIKILRENGFGKIYATGHSEGGMVIQLIQSEVDGVIIHSMTCIPLSAKTPNNVNNKYLHLVSSNDPFLNKTPGRKFSCDDRSNYTTVISNTYSHDALSDSTWESKIKVFVGVN